MNKPFAIMLLLAIGLAACKGADPKQQTGAPDSAARGQPSGKEASMKIDSRLEPCIERAISDLADRLKIDETEIEIAQARFVTWPDGALGCPEPRMMYTQALVPGYRIRLVANGTQYHYHGSRNRPPFYCPAERVGAPVPGNGESKDIR